VERDGDPQIIAEITIGSMALMVVRLSEVEAPLDGASRPISVTEMIDLDILTVLQALLARTGSLFAIPAAMLRGVQQACLPPRRRPQRIHLIQIQWGVATQYQVSVSPERLDRLKISSNRRFEGARFCRHARRSVANPKHRRMSERPTTG